MVKLKPAKGDIHTASPATATKLLAILEETYPDACVTLDFKNPFQLLIATILAAQCTDERVNRVTKWLFKRYATPKAFAEADQIELEEAIRSTGFYRNKAKSIIGCSKKIVEEFGGHVPPDRKSTRLNSSHHSISYAV